MQVDDLLRSMPQQGAATSYDESAREEWLLNIQLLLSNLKVRLHIVVDIVNDTAAHCCVNASCSAGDVGQGRLLAIHA